jgi:hypothetical protein
MDANEVKAMNILRLTAIFCLLSLLIFNTEAYSIQIEGHVMDKEGHPVPSAVVRVQATDISTVTDSLGRFTLQVEDQYTLTLTAWKKGYLNGGTIWSQDGSEPVIRLKDVPPDDNTGYNWISAESLGLSQKLRIALGRAAAFITGNEKLKSQHEKNCSNCHSPYVTDQWRIDAHSRSAVNPILLTIYNGNDMEGNPGIFPGYKLDFPDANGNCATCHAPGQAVNDPWGTDLNDIHGVAKEGVFCDLCHKIQDVELHSGGGYPGVLSIRFNRPPEGKQVFYGPYDDVIAGPDTFLPLYKKSLYCAPCHSAKFWDVPIYTDYDEWLESPYRDEGIECQHCHMTPDGETTFFVTPDKAGLIRDPAMIPTHNNPGCRDEKFMADAIRMEVNTKEIGDTLEVIIDITNEKAGHHYPTGVPMRNMILLVDVIDREGKNLEYLDGPVVPEWGGVGSPEENNFAGLPGKGFAKILADIPKNYPKLSTNIKMPTPHWRQAVIVSDNRIPARETDASRYRFRIGVQAKEDVTVHARLIYRRAFKEWIDAKKWPLKDLEIATEIINFNNQEKSSPNELTTISGGYR